eukprot:TRINITY_DN33617_c0_g1_i1.p1 TRINITY_DN33617_c0_g1~~TRINITY_DN33617_c0_g1_i1.p1  ORF type:complete len:211 (+),score=72.72 TRINITY_DN33617_c0_g1_i1:181-813(+)
MAGEAWRQFTPATVVPLNCMARTWNSGQGGQCDRKPVAGGAGLCVSHGKQAKSHGGLAHGRVDGPIPEAKLLEFQRKAASASGAPRPAAGRKADAGAAASAKPREEASVAAAMAAAQALRELRAVREEEEAAALLSSGKEDLFPTADGASPSPAKKKSKKTTLAVAGASLDSAEVAAALEELEGQSAKKRPAAEKSSPQAKKRAKQKAAA